jgi:hypothetical protein
MEGMGKLKKEKKSIVPPVYCITLFKKNRAKIHKVNVLC